MHRSALARSHPWSSIVVRLALAVLATVALLVPGLALGADTNPPTHPGEVAYVGEWRIWLWSLIALSVLLVFGGGAWLRREAKRIPVRTARPKRRRA